MELKRIQILDIPGQDLEDWVKHEVKPLWYSADGAFALSGSCDDAEKIFTIQAFIRTGSAPLKSGRPRAYAFVRYLLLQGFEVYAIIGENTKVNDYLFEGVTFV